MFNPKTILINMVKDIKNNNRAFAFITVGKTKESTEAAEFKRYIGVGSTRVLAVNPSKQERDELLGYEIPQEPEYTGTDDNGQFARVSFIVATDPAVNNGIDIKNILSFTLRPVQACNRDQTKLQVIDDFGNSAWGPADDVKAKKQLLNANGTPLKIAPNYHIACRGEADLVAFLKAYLNVEDAFDYANGTWSLKKNTEDYVFKLEHIKNYFTGDFSEIKEAIKLQPHNKVKLLYGVRTTDEGKQYQAIASGGEFILRNSANSHMLARLEKNLFNAKQAGRYATTEFKVQELQEFSVTPTDLSQPAQSSEDSEAMPWD